MPKSTTDTFHILGTIIRILSLSPASGGAFSLYEYRTKPGSGSPLNRHPGDDESFYVLSGHYEFVVDGATSLKRPRDFLSIPSGAPHRFHNPGPGDATMLSINVPGAIHDRFFTTAGEPLASGTMEFPTQVHPPDTASIRAIAESCGIEFLPEH